MSHLNQLNSATISLMKVWDILSTNLRDVRSQLHDVNDQLYGVQDRIAYLEIIQDSLMFIGERRVSKVDSFFDMEELIRKVSDIGKYGAAIKILHDFHNRCKNVFRKLQDIKQILSDNILEFLELYCSDYRKLGIADDSFYNALQSRTAVVDNYMERFEELSGFVNDGNPIPQDLFGYSFFSQELSIELDCDSFPVLRVIPDLIQKLEMSCDIAADWLRTDKVYVQEMEKEIESLQGKVSDIERAVGMKKIKYDRLFTNFKSKQTKWKQCDSKIIIRDVVHLETKKAHVESELIAIRRKIDAGDHKMQEVADCEATDSEYESDSSTRHGFDRSTFSRCSHLKGSSLSTKCENLQVQKRNIDSTILQKHNQLHDIKELKSAIENLSKKIRATGRQKVKLVEELKWCQGQVDRLTGLLKEKMYPDQKQIQVIRNDRKAPRKTKSKRKNSLELEEAFNIVKNSIGQGWKDLARTLPYSPARDLQQINSEIKAIEYENRGQLKEQAYQTLIEWSSQNGRRASIERLQETLRELHENKLADEIEEKLLNFIEAPASDLSRLSSD